MEPLTRQMYRLDRERIDLAREFKARPFGVHSPELQAALNQLRAVHPGGKLILVCTKAYREWTLGQLRGDPPRTYLFEDLVFDSLERAEWAVFKLRWRILTGTDLTLE